jgi:hypothetical protein
MMPDMVFELDFFVGIGLVLVLLSFEKSTNTNTIPAFGMVFQYNTIPIVHLWLDVHVFVYYMLTPEVLWGPEQSEFGGLLS